MNKRILNRSAFSLIELSIVLIVIGLVVAGIFAGKKLVDTAKISGMQSATKSSPLRINPDISRDVILWLDAASINGLNGTGVTDVQL